MTPWVGVVVPAHDEEELLADCLAGLRAAAGAVRDRARVAVLVVADACSDRTEAIARRHHVGVRRLAARNVGRARAAGAATLLARRIPPVWLATTDADSVVPRDWLSAQLAARDAGADAWVGTVAVTDWAGLPHPVRHHYRAAYDDGGSGDAHRHVHGASLGIAAEAYRAVGGFPPRATAEDVALVAALDRGGYRVLRDRAHPVVTSARTDGRAPDGFAGHLRALTRHVMPASPGSPPSTPLEPAAGSRERPDRARD
ncbi:glycosyl transferase [Actinomycetospora sp. NBRC 106375]|uniref:glycosyltransferase n=1 Tax=Actinomycetospora sp. NBRC 106375 TaxID=3032207 RepID=UPI0024A55776|nr:glycosyltransferase family 2 protein [Actinomycetospora sp. NBRC 106375]GLZ46383.1 glycosyl transferase [Actinomycetospora sp. NBRC 106375]